MMKTKNTRPPKAATNRNQQTGPAWKSHARVIAYERPPSKPSPWVSRRVSVTLPADVWELADQEARRAGVKIGEAVSFVAASLKDFGDLALCLKAKNPAM